MINPVADQNFVDLFRAEIAKEIERQTKILIGRTNDRQAGLIQGLQSAAMLMDSIVQRTNDNRSNPKQE